MPSEVITAVTPDGLADGRLIVPEGPSQLPLVVWYVDALGLRDTSTALGERLARAGYAVLQPNPYWRQGAFAPFDARTTFADAAERARVMGMIRAIDPARFVADTEALIGAVSDARVDTRRFATLGYCMGGRFAFIAATLLPARVVACAAIHAGGLVNDSPESPHRLADRAAARFYFGVADEDPTCTPEHQAILRTALDAAGLRYQLELNSGVRHGYAVPDFPVYDEAAAERHWQRVLALLGETLGAR